MGVACPRLPRRFSFAPFLGFPDSCCSAAAQLRRPPIGFGDLFRCRPFRPSRASDLKGSSFPLSISLSPPLFRGQSVFAFDRLVLRIRVFLVQPSDGSLIYTIQRISNSLRPAVLLDSVWRIWNCRFIFFLSSQFLSLKPGFWVVDQWICDWEEFWMIYWHTVEIFMLCFVIESYLCLVLCREHVRGSFFSLIIQICCYTVRYELHWIYLHLVAVIGVRWC